MSDPTPSEGGPAGRGILLVLVLLVVGGLTAWWFIWRPQAEPQAVPQAITSPAAVARVVALRNDAGNAIYLSLDAGSEKGLKPGDKLNLWRDGKPVARVLIELADAGRATARVIEDSWAAGAEHSVVAGQELRP